MFSIVAFKATRGGRVIHQAAEVSEETLSAAYETARFLVPGVAILVVKDEDVEGLLADCVPVGDKRVLFQYGGI